MFLICPVLMVILILHQIHEEQKCFLIILEITLRLREMKDTNDTFVLELL